jgi:hypothetical protein
MWQGVSGIPEIVKTVKDRTGKLLALGTIAKSMGLGFKASSSAATRRIMDMPRKLRSSVILLKRPNAPYGVQNLWDWIRIGGYSSMLSSSSGWTESVVKSASSVILLRDPEQIRHKIDKIIFSFNLAWKIPVLAAEVHQRWWKETIIGPFSEPIFKALDELRDLRFKTMKASKEYTEELCLQLLDRYEYIDELVARLPQDVKLYRSMTEQSAMKRVRFPKRVKMWKRFSSYAHKSMNQK